MRGIQLMSYTALFNIVSEMGACNDFYIKPISEWPDLTPDFDIAELNNQAIMVTENEVLDFVDGEEGVCDEIVKRHGIEKLHTFLNEIFDGDLHDKIAV